MAGQKIGDSSGDNSPMSPITMASLPLQAELTAVLFPLLLAATLSSAHADDVVPTCDPVAPVPTGSMSVAWVSPAGARVGLTGRLTVVPTRALRAWMDRQGDGLGRVLQGLGLRRSDKEPKRAWKVTVFDVDVASLCRPIDGEPGTLVGNVPLCEHGARGVSVKDTECGYATDLSTDGHGLDVFLIDWSKAAERGFCVLPSERFLTAR